MTAYQLVDQTFGDGTNRSLPITTSIVYQFDGDEIIETDDDLSGFVTSGSLQVPTAAQIAAHGGADVTVTPIADLAAGGQAERHSIQEIAEDVVPSIDYTTTKIILASSATGTKTILVASTNAGQELEVQLILRTGGQYELAVDGGTLTLDLAAESARLVRNAADDTWLVLELTGATVV